MFNLNGSRAEVASLFPRVLRKATRHTVIATSLQAFSICPNAQGNCWWRGTTGTERISQFPGTRFYNGHMSERRVLPIKIPE